MRRANSTPSICVLKLGNVLKRSICEASRPKPRGLPTILRIRASLSADAVLKHQGVGAISTHSHRDGLPKRSDGIAF